MPVRLLILVLVAHVAACERAPSELRVYAASSLAEVTAAFADELEANTHVELAGSQVLRLQILEGAPADVFMSANERLVQELVEGGHCRDASAVAAGELVLVVPADNPGGVRSFEDLAQVESIVVAQPEVPAGRYTEQLLRLAEGRYGAERVEAIRRRIRSRESNVRLVRAKIALGEADAAFIYRSDVDPAAMRIIELPMGVCANYWACEVLPLREGSAAARAAWMRLLHSERGRALFEEHGFAPPETP